MVANPTPRHRGNRGIDLLPTPRLLQLQQAYVAMIDTGVPVPATYLASVLAEIAGEISRREVLA